MIKPMTDSHRRFGVEATKTNQGEPFPSEEPPSGIGNEGLKIVSRRSPQTIVSGNASMRIDAGEPAVSVVIPCLNEVQSIATCVVKAKMSFATLNVTGEVIV